jgi:hypothetical protein
MPDFTTVAAQATRIRRPTREKPGSTQVASHVFGQAWALLPHDDYLTATGEAVDSSLIAAVETTLGLP